MFLIVSRAFLPLVYPLKEQTKSAPTGPWDNPDSGWANWAAECALPQLLRVVCV